MASSQACLSVSGAETATAQSCAQWEHGLERHGHTGTLGEGAQGTVPGSWKHVMIWGLVLRESISNWGGEAHRPM